MRIIKHGDKLLYREQIVSCPNCSCEFGFSLMDVESYISYNNDTWVSGLFVKCPECHKAYLIQQEPKEPAADEVNNSTDQDHTYDEDDNEEL